LTLVAPDPASFAGPRLGLGAYFEQPGEVGGSAGKPDALSARGQLSLRMQLARLSERLAFVPQLAALFPQRNDDGELSTGMLLNGDFAWLVGSTRRLAVLFGPGLAMDAAFSQAREISQSGDFVTPAGSALSWLFTWNAGLGYALDSRLGLVGEAFASRITSDDARRFRFALEVSYAL
jgi:hypothetical protein